MTLTSIKELDVRREERSNSHMKTMAHSTRPSNAASMHLNGLQQQEIPQLVLTQKSCSFRTKENCSDRSLKQRRADYIQERTRCDCTGVSSLCCLSLVVITNSRCYSRDGESPHVMSSAAYGDHAYRTFYTSKVQSRDLMPAQSYCLTILWHSV